MKSPQAQERLLRIGAALQGIGGGMARSPGMMQMGIQNLNDFRAEQERIKKEKEDRDRANQFFNSAAPLFGENVRTPGAQNLAQQFPGTLGNAETALGGQAPDPQAQARFDMFSSLGETGVGPALQYLTREPKDPKTTSAMANAQALGLVPGTQAYNDYVRDVTMKPGSTVNVNSGDAKPTPYQAREISEGDRIYKDAIESIRTAANSQVSLRNIAGAIQNGLNTGAAAEPRAFAAEFLIDMGAPQDTVNRFLQANPADVAQFNSASTELVASLLKRFGTKPTDADLRQAAKIVPQIGQDPSAVLRLVQVLQEQNQAEIDFGKRVISANRRGDPLVDLEAEYQATRGNPIDVDGILENLRRQDGAPSGPPGGQGWVSSDNMQDLPADAELDPGYFNGKLYFRVRR